MRPLLLLTLVALGGIARAQNTGLEFTHGTNMHFDVPYTPVSVPRTGLTIEAWITYDEAPVTSGVYRWPTIVRQDVDAGEESYFLRVSAANTGATVLTFAFRTSGGLNRVDYSFTPGQFASWTHVAATYDGAAQRLFVNGAEVASSPLGPAQIIDNGDILRIGNGDDVAIPGQETWSGRIDELRIWPFARSADEIVETMNDELHFFPGDVITFNLNSSFTDSSAGLVGTPLGSPPFVASPPLNMAVSGATEYGSHTSSCTVIRTALATPARIDTPSFTVRCIESPINGTGFFFGSLGSLNPAVNLFGMDVHVDPLLLIATLPATSNGLRTASVSTPLMNDPSLIGQTFYAQFAFFRPVCAPINFVSSNALAFTVL